MPFDYLPPAPYHFIFKIVFMIFNFIEIVFFRLFNQILLAWDSYIQILILSRIFNNEIVKSASYWHMFVASIMTVYDFGIGSFLPTTLDLATIRTDISTFAVGIDRAVRVHCVCAILHNCISVSVHWCVRCICISSMMSMNVFDGAVGAQRWKLASLSTQQYFAINRRLKGVSICNCLESLILIDLHVVSTNTTSITKVHAEGLF